MTLSNKNNSTTFLSAHSHHPTPAKHRRLSLSFNEPYTEWRNFVELMILLPLQLPIAWHCCWRPDFFLILTCFFQPRNCLSSSWEMSFEFGMLVFDFCGCRISTYCQSILGFLNFGADFKSGVWNLLHVHSTRCWVYRTCRTPATAQAAKKCPSLCIYMPRTRIIPAKGSTEGR